MFFIEYNLLFESILVSVNRSGLGGYLLRLFDFHTRQNGHYDRVHFMFDLT